MQFFWNVLLSYKINSIIHILITCFFPNQHNLFVSGGNNWQFYEVIANYYSIKLFTLSILSVQADVSVMESPYLTCYRFYFPFWPWKDGVFLKSHIKNIHCLLFSFLIHVMGSKCGKLSEFCVCLWMNCNDSCVLWSTTGCARYNSVCLKTLCRNR